MSPQASIERELKAARQAGDTSVTRASATTAVHGQEGVKSEYGKTGQAQEMADITDRLDVDKFVEDSQFKLAKGYLGASSAESGAISGAGVLGDVIAGTVTLASDVGKVMSVGDAARMSA